MWHPPMKYNAITMLNNGVAIMPLQRVSHHGQDAIALGMAGDCLAVQMYDGRSLGAIRHIPLDEIVPF